MRVTMGDGDTMVTLDSNTSDLQRLIVDSGLASDENGNHQAWSLATRLSTMEQYKLMEAWARVLLDADKDAKVDRDWIVMEIREAHNIPIEQEGSNAQ